MHIGKIASLLKKIGIAFTENADTSMLTSMRCGGNAAALAEPCTAEELITLVRLLRSEKIKFRVIGAMTNTLPYGGFYDGVLIRTLRINRLEFTDNNTVIAETGATLRAIVTQAMRRGLGGIEAISGIPGSVGGAVYGNAGANGLSISDALVGAEAYDIASDSIISLSCGELSFDYRDSIFKMRRDLIILRAEFRLTKMEEREISLRVAEYTEKRRASQPLSFPSLGSIFKHPTGDFAPRLIESLGLKGYSVGGAAISDIHAGFIVNLGEATTEDVLELINQIKCKVEKAYGIMLEEEINILRE